MGGRQTFRLLIVGKSGSGKSTLAREVMRRMEGRYRHLVIVNRKTEFAELAEGRYRVSEKGDPGPALKRHRRVIGPSPRAWGLLGGACTCRPRRAVHPHVRGDYAFRPWRPIATSGPSPRAWGLPRGEPTERIGKRSIPTCVGTTYFPRLAHTVRMGSIPCLLYTSPSPRDS